MNSAAISPIREHVVVGGGQDAMDVTTTSTKIGKFDARFFHMVFEEEFGRVKVRAAELLRWKAPNS